MNFVCDESVDAPIVEQLRADGHNVVCIADISPSITDDQILERANAEQCPLLTGDKDFGELVYRLHRVTHGVVLIRLSGLSTRLKAHIVSDAIRLHGREMIRGFTVISPGLIRIRHDL
ncbi:MAG: DUF5615 family PIN-like protein [Kiritimatiellae bacterium]|nr:DUF5615 family PIN-like protein [Kiritimatiellia bacterium]